MTLTNHATHLCKCNAVDDRLKYTPPHVCVTISDGRDQIAIRFNRDLNRNEDSIQTLRDSIQVPCDLILIRFKF